MSEENTETTNTIDPAEYAALVASVKKLEENNKALLQEKAETKAKAKEAQEAARIAAEEAAKKSGDVATLEKSWQQKLAAREAELKGQLEKYQGSIKDLTAGATARQIAAELALPGHADGLLPHIAGRIVPEFADDGTVNQRILDKNGKPSAMTLDDLKAEIQSTSYLAPMLIGSQASGAAKPGSKGGASKNTMKRSEWESLDFGAKSKFFKDGGKLVAG